MKKRYLIIADDFTGANDTGVQLCRRGYPTDVLFAGKPLDTEKSVVIDTESRTIDSKKAYETVRDALGLVDFSGFGHVIKKIDSTMRGNIPAEIKAVDESYKPELIVFAPAYPDMGRTTEDGVQRLKGVEICKTELAADPKNPVTEDRLTALLSGVYEEPVVLKRLADVRDAGFSFEEERIFACDAETNEDLHRIIRAAKKTGKRTLYIGSAGIADSLMETENPADPAFAVVASVSSVTNAQMHCCEKEGYTLIKIPVHDILLGKKAASVYRDEAIAALKRGEDTILLTNTAYDRSELELSIRAGEKLGMSFSGVGDYVREMVGTMAREVLESARVSGVFITGGDTALGLLRSLEADGSEIVSEILVGIPMIRVKGGAFEGLKLVSKAGAFGAEDAAAFALRKIKEKQ